MAFVATPLSARRARTRLTTDKLCRAGRSEGVESVCTTLRWQCRLDSGGVQSSGAENGSGSKSELSDMNGSSSGDEAAFRPHALRGEDVEEDGDVDECPPLDLVDGYLDNAKVRPKIDIDADEYMLMWKLRKMLHEDDFKKIFDSKSMRIGEF